MMPETTFRARAAVAPVLLILAAVACGQGSDPGAAGASPQPATAASPAAAVSPAAEPVVREILARTTNPPGAPGYDLTLVRYTIAPGAELPPHIHPGIQMASIESGTLTYRILSGTVVVHRRVDGTGTPAGVETVTGPTVIELGPGDAVVEDRTMLHFGANETDAPVVILAALITDSGSDLAVAQPAE